MSKDFEEKFLSYCKSENLEVNQSQIKVIKRLQDFFNQNFTFNFFGFFSKKKSKKAFYLHGGVGVGKTMVLNFFFNSLNIKRKRLHFNEFMISYHDFVHKNKKKQNSLNLFVSNIKKKYELLFFDEFQVTNIVDAMILGRLFKSMFKENLKIIVTSNSKIEELYKIPDLKLLTSKPMFIIANIDDGYDKEILNAFKNTLSENQKCIVIDTKIEQEISQLSPEEQFEFLKELEISDTALNQIIQTGYQLLGLKTFFTSGEKETRAWSAKKEFNAGQCSGIIHTDIERGFIRAETVSYNDYISHNGE